MVDEYELREWMRQVQRGRLSRRTFVQRIVALGLTAPFANWMLSGCGPGAAPAAPGAAPPAASPAVASSPAAAPGAAAASGMQVAAPMALPNRTKRGGDGTLKLLWWQAPSHANAHLSTGTKDTDAARLFYEPLAAFDRDGNFVPILAAEIPTRQNEGLSADGKSVTWRLKKDVQWHDGKPLTVDDVIFTWEYAADPATAAVTAGNYQDIDRIETIDDLTCKVIFKEPKPGWYIPFFGGAGHILPKHLISQYKGQNARNSPYNLKPVGTGPFKVVDFKPEDIVLGEANRNYHVSGAPFFDRVEMKGGGDATSAARAVMQTGEFDFAWNMQVEWDVLSTFERFGRGKVVINPGAGLERLQFNFTDPWTEVDGERSSLKVPHPFLTDFKVRQALALACDRKSIVDELYGPVGTIGLNTLHQPKIFQSPNTTWEYNLDKANALLDETGWRRGPDGVRQKDGKRMKVVYSTSINSVRQKTQAIVKRGWEQIGLEVELKSVDAGVYFNNDPANPDNYPHFYTDVQMFTNGPGSPDPFEYMLIHYGPEIAQKANQWRGRNVERWQNDEYDRLLREAEKELDPVKRAALFIRMNDIVIENVVMIPLVARNGVSAVANRLGNLQLTTWDSNLWNLRGWTAS